MTRRTLTPAHDLTPTADTVRYEDNETNNTSIETEDTDVSAEQYNISPTVSDVLRRSDTEATSRSREVDSLDDTERSQIAF